MAGKSGGRDLASDYGLDYFVGVSLNELSVKDGVGYTLETAPPELLAEVMLHARVNFTAFLMSGVGGRMLNPMTDLVLLAEKVGLTLSQMRKLLAEPEMQKALAHWHNGADEMLRRRATLSMFKAIDAMEDLMDDGDADVKPHHRVSAAKTLTEMYKAVQPVAPSGGTTVNVQMNNAATRFASDAAVPVIEVAPRRYLVDNGDGEGAFVEELATTSRNS